MNEQQQPPYHNEREREKIMAMSPISVWLPRQNKTYFANVSSREIDIKNIITLTEFSERG